MAIPIGKGMYLNVPNRDSAENFMRHGPPKLFGLVMVGLIKSGALFLISGGVINKETVI